MIRITKFIFLLLLFFKTAYSQTTYPKINGYVGIMHPVVTFSNEETTTNFDGHYVVSFPMGINLWKTPKVGFSFEIVPTIKDEDGVSKSSNLTFHPGVLLPLGSGFSFAGRVAFETSGRYGFTRFLIKHSSKVKIAVIMLLCLCPPDLAMINRQHLLLDFN